MDKFLNNIGDSIIIEVKSLVKGTISVNSFEDNIIGITDTRYVSKKFRVTADNLFYTEWADLTNENVSLNCAGLTSESSFTIEVKYTRLGTDASGVIEFVDINFNGIGENKVFVRPTIDKSIFSDLIDKPETKAIEVNLFKKLYFRGIIPKYITRAEDMDKLEDADFIALFSSVAKFFALIIQFAKRFDNFNNDLELLKENVKQNNLFIDEYSITIEELQYLSSHLYDEIRKRGTNLVFRKKDVDNLVDGEFLRLFNIKADDEFLKSKIPTNKFGWVIGKSSPLYRGTNEIMSLNKTAENTEDFIDKTKFITTGDSNAPFTFVAPEDFNPLTQPVNIIEVFKTCSELSKRYIHAVKDSLAFYSLIMGERTIHGYIEGGIYKSDVYDNPYALITEVIPAGDISVVTVDSTSGFPESGSIRVLDTAQYALERYKVFFYTSKTETEFIGDVQTFPYSLGNRVYLNLDLRSKTNNHFIVCGGLNVTPWPWGQYLTESVAILFDTLGGTEAQEVAVRECSEWLYCGNTIEQIAGGNTGFGYGSLKHIHLEEETQLKRLNYTDFYGVPLTGVLTIPKSINHIGQITDFNGWVGFGYGYLTKVIISENVTNIIDSFNAHETIERFDCYPKLAPQWWDGNYPTVMNSHPVELHIRKDAVGYDIHPWTDVTQFSSIIKDLPAPIDESKVLKIQSNNYDGLGGSDKVENFRDFLIPVNSGLDYEITFEVLKRSSCDNDLLFAVEGFDSRKNKVIDSFITSSGSAVSEEFFDESIENLREYCWYKVRGIIHCYSTKNHDSKTNMGWGSDLHFNNKFVKYILPKIQLHGGTFQPDLVLRNYKIRPLTFGTNIVELKNGGAVKSKSNGFIQSMNLFYLFVKNNNKNLSNEDIERLANRYILPYNLNNVFIEL